MKKRYFILLLGLIAVLTVLICSMRGEAPPEPEKPAETQPAEQSSPTPSVVPEVVTVYSPTCTQAGYELYENPETGSTRVVDGEPALGHDVSADGVCLRCGWEEPGADPDAEERSSVEALPRIDLSGDMKGISKDQRITLGFDFASEERQFSCYSYTTWQGHSSLAYPKKNYTVRLYLDETITEKNRMHFGGWQMEHKYILKANYLDATQSRNLLAARLWGNMAATRANLHPRLEMTSNYGAVDGFPVTVWHDGRFHGLYTMNLHKDEDLYGMGSAERDAVVIANARTMDEALFRAPAAFEDDVSDWELEYCGTDEDDAWAKESFNALIEFVISSDDETFRSRLSSHLDVDSAIDYLLFLYLTGLEDNAAKDLVLIKYEDSPWIATVYDMEAAFGLAADGASAKDAGSFLPSKSAETWSSNTGSLLWDRLLQNYAPRISERWQDLRQGVLAQDAVLAQAEGMINAIPAQAIEMDRALYPERALIENPSGQIMDYIRQRIPLLDDIFAVHP